jgi:hypothetical protein
MNALSVAVRPIAYGWAVQLSNGQELARFHGPGAQRRAMRYVARIMHT